MPTRPDSLSDKQRRLRYELTAACPEMIDLTDLVRSFAELPRPQHGNSQRLDECIATARAASLPHLHAFTRDLDQDHDAVHAAVTLPYHNGGAGGVNTKTKRIMRQMHAPRRLHPATPPHPARLTSLTVTTGGDPEPNS